MVAILNGGPQRWHYSRYEMKLSEQMEFPNLELKSVSGEKILIPDAELFVHLQFRRFTGCPICNTHIGELSERINEIKNAGIKEVVFFHSQAEDIQSFQKDIPLTFVADPEKKYYREFSVERSLMYLSLSALGAAIRGMARGKISMKMTGGPQGLPAEFLVSPSGEIVAAKYGKHAYDQWSVDELLRIVKSKS